MLNPVLTKNRLLSPLGFPVLLVLIASLLRLIPVILAWPYPVGFDTNAFYLPGIFQGVPSLYTIFVSAQLNQFLLSSIYLLYPHPFVILNAFSIVLQAALAESIYLYARKVTKLDLRLSFVAGLVFTLSILTLRLTWDQYRMTLALIFVLLAWVSLGLDSKRKKYFSVPLIILSVLSNPLPAGLFILSMLLYLFLKWRSLKQLQVEILTTVVGLSFFIAQQYFAPPGQLIATSVPIKFLGFSGELIRVVNGLDFLVFTGWTLLVLLPVMIFRIRNEYHWIWLGFVFASATLGPFVGLGVPPSWIYWLISFPLSILFVLALKNNQGKFVKYLGTFLIVVSLAMSLVYLSTSPTAPNAYFASTLSNSGSPTGYLQSTVDLPQQPPLMNLLKKSISYVGNNSTIYLPAQFYGLALVLPNPRHVKLRNIGEIDPSFSNTSFSQIVQFKSSYTIWLTKPNGWYGVSSLPENFHVSLNGGEFSLYVIS